MHPYYSQDPPRDAGDIFNGASSGSQPQQQMSFQQQLGSLQQVNMEMLENLLMQENAAQGGQQQQQHQQPQHAHGTANPQAMLEHQVKINQLQQLQQLQQQIFQQQVRFFALLGSWKKFEARGEEAMRLRIVRI